MASEAQLSESFAAAVASLNEQFALWVAAQKQQKPATLWSHGALDYLRHSVMIRRDSADKAQASGKSAGPSDITSSQRNSESDFQWSMANRNNSARYQRVLSDNACGGNDHVKIKHCMLFCRSDRGAS